MGVVFEDERKAAHAIERRESPSNRKEATRGAHANMGNDKQLIIKVLTDTGAIWTFPRGGDSLSRVAYSSDMGCVRDDLVRRLLGHTTGNVCCVLVEVMVRWGGLLGCDCRIP